MDTRARATWCCFRYSVCSSVSSLSFVAVFVLVYSRIRGRTSSRVWCSHFSKRITSCDLIERHSNANPKNCCHFFHLCVVFLLTLLKHESIHSSTAIYIAGSMQPIEKGRIGKWQRKRQPRRHLQRRPRRKPQRRSNCGNNQKGNTLGGA